MKTHCWFCGGEMFWNNDYTFEECGYEGDGLVGILSCHSCEAMAEFTLPQNFDNRDDSVLH